MTVNLADSKDSKMQEDQPDAVKWLQKKDICKKKLLRNTNTRVRKAIKEVILARTYKILVSIYEF